MRNVNSVSFKLLKLGDEPVLAGRVEGKRAMLHILERLPASVPEVIIVDFEGVEIATSSFLSEAILRLRDHLRLGKSPSCLLVVNLGSDVQEELDDLLRRMGQAMFAGDLVDGKLANGRLIGELETKLGETLRFVSASGETTAAQLHAEHADRTTIGATAWNNRLSSLADMGLLLEKPTGRAKRYRPVMEL